MTAAGEPAVAAGRAIAVLAEPRRYASALELGVSLAVGTEAEELIVLAPRPRLLRGALRLAGHDPDELTEGAAAAMREGIRRQLEGLAPGLPHRIVESEDRGFRDLLGLAAVHRCSALVIPRRAFGWTRIGRPRAARAADLELVIAP